MWNPSKATPAPSSITNQCSVWISLGCSCQRGQTVINNALIVRIPQRWSGVVNLTAACPGSEAGVQKIVEQPRMKHSWHMQMAGHPSIHPSGPATVANKTITHTKHTHIQAQQLHTLSNTSTCRPHTSVLGGHFMGQCLGWSLSNYSSTCPLVVAPTSRALPPFVPIYFWLSSKFITLPGHPHHMTPGTPYTQIPQKS